MLVQLGLVDARMGALFMAHKTVSVKGYVHSGCDLVVRVVIPRVFVVRTLLYQLVNCIPQGFSDLARAITVDGGGT